MGEYIQRRKYKTGGRQGVTTEELAKCQKFTREGEELVRKSKWVVWTKELSRNEKVKVV